MFPSYNQKVVNEVNSSILGGNRHILAISEKKFEKEKFPKSIKLGK